MRRKKTPIGKIPKDWKVVKIEEVAKKIKAGGTPKTTVKEYYENGTIPFVKIEDVTSSKKYLRDTKVKITELGLKNSSAWLVPPKSLLFAMYGSIGAVAINEIPVATNQAILGIIPEGKRIDLEFMYYLLKFFGPYFEKHAKQTTQANLTAKIVRSFQIPLPPLPEQKKIAQILCTVDEAIEKTDLAIEKTERLKKGLMQRLLIKGTKHERFKKTEIGEIPEEWKVVRLGNEKYFTIVMGQSPPSSSYNADGQGLPFLQGKAEFGSIFPNPILYTTKPLKIVEKGDILISVRAPVGDVNIAPFKLCIGRGLGAIRVNKENGNNFFLFYYLSYIKSRIEILGSGSTFKAIKKVIWKGLRYSSHLSPNNKKSPKSL